MALEDSQATIEQGGSRASVVLPPITELRVPAIESIELPRLLHVPTFSGPSQGLEYNHGATGHREACIYILRLSSCLLLLADYCSDKEDIHSQPATASDSVFLL